MNREVLNKIKNAPTEPGVYIFYQNSQPLYVGKAINLKNRLAQYLKAGDSKAELLRKETNGIKWHRLSSGIEALIVESQLIKKLKPRYNVLMRDDKSYFYVAFTKEIFPRIFITHKNHWSKVKGQKSKAELIGPFTEGKSLRIVLKILRRYFPYCTCFKSHHRFCLNAQINNCPGFCCRINSRPDQKDIRQYQKNVKAIKDFLLGKKKLKNYPKISDKIRAFENVLAHREFVRPISPISPMGPIGQRAECYDVSHLSGKEPVGAMTAWVKKDSEWVADKNLWRKFKIKSAPRNDDPRAIAEILGRRLNHPEWPYPDLIIIDGGLTQLNAAKKTIGLISPIGPIRLIKIISFAKPRKLVYGLEKSPMPIGKISPDLNRLIQKTIYETHKFVIRYHRSKRSTRMNI